MPQLEFAALAGWGTTAADRALLRDLPNVTLLETVPDIEDVLGQARLLLMPSLWYEGFGLIAMEAMLRGLPVVASRQEAVAETLGAQGLAIEGDDDTLATAVHRVIADADLRERLVGTQRERYARLFAPAAMERGFLEALGPLGRPALS